MINSRVVAHTRYRNTELITIEVEFHRFILAQLNTHRSFSRNYQSSRAMPILKQMEQVANNPAMPVFYGSAQKGMVAGEELTGWRLGFSKLLIRGLSKISLLAVRGLQKLGLSKEITNRYLEPWMYTKGVITATRDAWNAYMVLRLEHDAQPEIQALSSSIADQINISRPTELMAGEWHLPYIKISGGDVKRDIETATAAAAQVSYRTLDTSPNKVRRVFEMLKFPKDGVYKSGEGNVHFSPAEHCACAVDRDDTHLSGNFHTKDYVQYRKLLELGIESDYIN